MSISSTRQKLIKFCTDKPKLNAILSEGLYRALSMYNRETSQDNVLTMVTHFTQEYQYEELGLFLDVISDIESGKRKIYGMVTPHDIREMITGKLEALAIARENTHNVNKGFAEVEVAERVSGRISDFFNQPQTNYNQARK